MPYSIVQKTNDGIIRRKHVGSHRREPLARRGRLMRKGDAQRKRGAVPRKRGNGPMRRLNVRRRWRQNFWS